MITSELIVGKIQNLGNSSSTKVKKRNKEQWKQKTQNEVLEISSIHQ
jgi:hypothetical protein